jgi:protein SCO1
MRHALTLSALAACWLAHPLWAAGNISADDIASKLGFDQHLDTALPLELHFRDESGAQVRLGDFFGTVPVVLVFSYYGCSSLCPTVIDNLAGTLDRSGLNPAQYQVLAISIDPRDSPSLALRKKRLYLQHAHPADGRAWHLLTGDDAAISVLTRTTGFRYAYDAQSAQYAHPAGIVLITPRGSIARYFFGFDFTPDQLRAAFSAARAERVSSPIERLLLLCFHFDPATGKYSWLIVDALRWMGGATLLLLLAGFALSRKTAGGRGTLSGK